MTARTRQAAACLEAAPAVSLTDALQWLIETHRDLDAHRNAHGWPELDPRGNALEDAAHHARLFAVSALSHHGIDADELGRVL